MLEAARDCSITNASGRLATEWVLCLEAQPALNVGRYILWFISGEGFFNSTELFIGIYTNATIGLASSIINGETHTLWYNMPLAYLFTGGTVYIISLLAIVFRYVWCGLYVCVCIGIARILGGGVLEPRVLSVWGKNFGSWISQLIMNDIHDNIINSFRSVITLDTSRT